MSRSVGFLKGILGACLLLAPVLAVAHPPDARIGQGNGARADAPGNHGMFMIGSETLYLVHMPMLTHEKHMYQVVLRVRLPLKVMRDYQRLRNEHPETAYNLINVDDDKFTLPQLKSGEVRRFNATIFDGYSNDGGGEPGPVIADQVPVVIKDVVVFRHFNFAIDRPESLVYTLFGDSDEAHLIHYITRDPDFQHILTSHSAPDMFSSAQLNAGIELSFPALDSMPLGCSPPVREGVHDVRFQGMEDALVKLDLTDGLRQIWYSTGNLLNKEDPCA